VPNPTQTTESPEDDFEAMFAEATAANATPSDEGVADAGDAAATATAAETPAPQAPAPAAAAPAAEPAAAAPAAAPAANELPAELSPEDLKRQIAEAIHRERSAAQRISAVARENNDLKALVQRLQAQVSQTAAAPSAASAAPAAPAAPDTPDVLTEAKDLEAAVVKRAAAMVEPLKKQLEETIGRVDKATQAVSQVQEAVTPIQERTQRETFEATWKALDQVFGEQWRTDVRGDAFTGWIAQQPAQIQDLYAKAVTPEESAKVMNLFYAEKGNRPSPAPAAAAPAPAPAANPNQQRLRLAAGIAKTGAPPRAPAGPAPDDFDANFEAATKALKQA
jgi:hypothetical protein